MKADQKVDGYLQNGEIAGILGPVQWRNGRVSRDGGPPTLGAPDKNDHKKFDSTFLGFLEKCFNFVEEYHISGKFLGVSGKFFSYLGKIGVCRGGRSPKWSKGGPKVAD